MNKIIEICKTIFIGLSALIAMIAIILFLLATVVYIFNHMWAGIVFMSIIICILAYSIGKDIRGDIK
jgi:hypothetical protein